MRYYCPGCWQNFGHEFVICPHCGLDVAAFYQDKAYIDKVILALEHPEPSTPIRAAWLLGKRREACAVDPLIDTICQGKDIYLVRTAVAALIEIGGDKALAFINSLSSHPDFIVRRLVGNAADGPFDGGREG